MKLANPDSQGAPEVANLIELKGELRGMAPRRGFEPLFPA